MDPPPLPAVRACPRRRRGAVLTRWRLARRCGRACHRRTDAPSSRRGRGMRRQRGYRRRFRPADGRARCAALPAGKRQRADVQAAAVSLDRGRARPDRPRAQGDRVQFAPPVRALRDCGRRADDRVRMGAARRARRDTRGADPGRLVPVRERRAGRTSRYDAHFFRDARDNELSVDATRSVRCFNCFH